MVNAVRVSCLNLIHNLLRAEETIEVPERRKCRDRTIANVDCLNRYGGRSNPYEQRGGAPTGGYNPPQQGRYNTPQGGGYNSQPYGAPPPAYGADSQYNGAQPSMGRDQYGWSLITP
jgi:hypothetical protein